MGTKLLFADSGQIEKPVNRCKECFQIERCDKRFGDIEDKAEELDDKVEFKNNNLERILEIIDFKGRIEKIEEAINATNGEVGKLIFHCKDYPVKPKQGTEQEPEPDLPDLSNIHTKKLLDWIDGRRSGQTTLAPGIDITLGLLSDLERSIKSGWFRCDQSEQIPDMNKAYREAEERAFYAGYEACCDNTTFRYDAWQKYKRVK